MYRSADELSAALERRARGMRPANRPAVLEAAQVFKKGIEAEFSRNGLRVGAKLAGRPWKGVGYNQTGDDTVEIRAKSPAHLFNNPTAPHIIGARGFGSRAGIARRLGGRASRTRSGVRADGTRFRYSEAAELAVGPISGRGRLGARTSGRGKQALRFGGNHPVAYARHPGTRGRRSFGPGRDKTRPKAARKFLDEHYARLRWGR